MDRFTPSTVPGCRTPHFWLADGRSLYDAHGAGLHAAALRPDGRCRARFERPLRARGLPLAVLDVQCDELPGAYRHALVLSRPDQHVAWRGDRAPEDALALIDRLRGGFAGKHP